MLSTNFATRSNAAAFLIKLKAPYRNARG